MTSTRDKQRERCKRWRRENPERVRAYQREWEASHREERNEYQRDRQAAFSKDTRERRRAYHKSWRDKNAARLRPVALERVRADRLKEPLRQTWIAMKRRCLNPKDDAYENYGGRGISVCNRWARSFENFKRDVGPRPSLKHSLDRIDNDGDYEPGNCRWATQKEQMRNTRSNCILVVSGVAACISEWAEKLGVRPSIIDKRLKLGWSLARAVSDPPAKQMRMISFRGETHAMHVWAAKIGMPATVLANRMKRGWTIERALSTPSVPKPRRR